MNEQASKRYQTQQIMTASPAMLVFMLLDKAIVCLKEAIRAIEARDFENRWKANARAMEIISHLKSTLDHEKGGAIARNLEQLYTFMLALLPKVDFANDAAAARSVIDLLTPFRESWKELATRNSAQLQEAVSIAGQAPPPFPASGANVPQPAAVTPTKTGQPKPPPDRPRIAISA
jgi:flagellar secretion chaperone FliS